MYGNSVCLIISSIQLIVLVMSMEMLTWPLCVVHTVNTIIAEEIFEVD
jgi:hypothetical protein